MKSLDIIHKKIDFSFNRSDIKYLVISLLFSFIISIIFIREPDFVDDATYFQMCWEWLHGERNILSKAEYGRMGFFLQVIGVQWLFGYTYISYYVVSLTNQILFSGAFFLLVRIFFNRKFALLSVFVLLTSPVYLEYSSIMRIDNAALLWLCLGTYCLFRSLDAEGGSKKARFLFAFFAGSGIYLMFWIKEGTMPMAILFPLSLFFVKRDKRTYIVCAFIILTGVIWFSAECLINYHFFSDPLARVKAILSASDSRTKYFQGNNIYIRNKITYTWLLFRYPSLFLTNNIFYGTLLIFGLTWGMFFTFWKRNKYLIFIFIFAFGCWFFISCMLASINPLAPILRTKLRYISIAFIWAIPLWLTGVLCFFETIGKLLKKRLKYEQKIFIPSVLAVTIFFMFTSAYTMAKKPCYLILSKGNPLNKTAKLVYQLPNHSCPVNRIISGARSLRCIKMYLPENQWPKLKTLDKANKFLMNKPSDFVPGDLVVLNMSRLINNVKYNLSKKYKLPPFINKPPDNWFLVGETACRKFKIYYIADYEFESPMSELQENCLSNQRNLWHAYEYKSRKKISLKYFDDNNTFSIVLNSEPDVRLTTGKDYYHKAPKDPELFLNGKEIYGKFETNITGDLRIITANLVLFYSGKPRMVPLKSKKLNNNKSIFYFSLSPTGKRGFCPLSIDKRKVISYRLMLHLVGNGELVISLIK